MLSAVGMDCRSGSGWCLNSNRMLLPCKRVWRKPKQRCWPLRKASKNSLVQHPCNCEWVASFETNPKHPSSVPISPTYTPNRYIRMVHHHTTSAAHPHPLCYVFALFSRQRVTLSNGSPFFFLIVHVACQIEGGERQLSSWRLLRQRMNEEEAKKIIWYVILHYYLNLLRRSDGKRSVPGVAGPPPGRCVPFDKIIVFWNSGTGSIILSTDFICQNRRPRLWLFMLNMASVLPTLVQHWLIPRVFIHVSRCFSSCIIIYWRIGHCRLIGYYKYIC